MVKQTTFLKIEWYKNDDDKGGAMKEAFKNKQPDELTIISHTKKHGRCWANITDHRLIELLEKNNGVYEIITSFPMKAYFDIDKKGQYENLLIALKPLILQYFPNAEFAISGSITPEKTSYHIVLTNYIIHNIDEHVYFKNVVKHLNTLNDAFDVKVYTNNRNMKCINQSKEDGRVQEIIENQDYKQHLITCFFNSYPLPFTNTIPEEIRDVILIEKSKKTYDLGLLPKLKLKVPEHIDWNDISNKELLELLPCNSSFDFGYIHLVARFCFYNGIDFDAFLKWLKNKHPDLIKDDAGQRSWDKLKMFPEVIPDKIKQILTYFYPHLKKDKSYRDFAETFNIPSENIVEIETIGQSHFYSDKKYSVFNVGMGGGKTAQTIDRLVGAGSFCWIAPNKALSSNTVKRINDACINVNSYLDFNTKQKTAGALNVVEKIVIVLNSIHYIEPRRYYCLVIDEIETLLDKFLGDFMEQGNKHLKKKCWINFIDIIRKAEHVIFLDAFITTKTTNFIKMIENGSYDKMVIYKRINEPQTRTIVYQDDFQMTLNDIIQKIKNGHKLFIFYPYKKQTSVKGLEIPSMEQVYTAIVSQTKKNGIFYNADVDDKTKKELKDVNTSWADKSFVITNNIITCGVNYELLDFDYKYLFIACFNTPRDIIQVSYRARYLSTGIINICYMGKMNQTNTWLNDCKDIDCKIYTKLYNDILVEKKAPIKRSFQLFCVKAHYKQKVSTTAINDSITKEIDDLLSKQKCGFSYDSIQDICYGEAEFIQQKCLAQEATLYEKIKLRKYFFQKKFIETDEPVFLNIGDFPEDYIGLAEKYSAIQLAWDMNYNFFFEVLIPVLKHTDFIFNKIATYNGWENIFKFDVKKVKLSKELIDDIFNKFSFKFITRVSSPIKIVKEIYNTYFAKYIINSNIDENKNTHYSINEYAYPFYNFAKENLLLEGQCERIVYNNLEPVNDDCFVEI